jgi:hypothetical protein
VKNKPSDAFKPESQVQGIYDPRTSAGAPAQAQERKLAEVTILVEPTDVKAATRFLTDRQRKRPYSKALSWLGTLAVFAVIVGVFYAIHNLEHVQLVAWAISYFPAFAIGLITPIVLTTIYYRVWLQSADRKMREATMQGLTGRFHVTINPQTISFEDSQQQVISKWSRFMQIASTQDHIYLLQDPYSVNTIPRNAFANGEEADRFLEQMRAYHRAAAES